MINLDVISTCRLHSLQDQWGVGVLSEVIGEQQLQVEDMVSSASSSIAGTGERLDVYA